MLCTIKQACLLFWVDVVLIECMKQGDEYLVSRSMLKILLSSYGMRMVVMNHGLPVRTAVSRMLAVPVVMTLWAVVAVMAVRLAGLRIVHYWTVIMRREAILRIRVPVWVRHVVHRSCAAWMRPTAARRLHIVRGWTSHRKPYWTGGTLPLHLVTRALRYQESTSTSSLPEIPSGGICYGPWREKYICVTVQSERVSPTAQGTEA